ncbi:uncharacterized protein [Asterias amurensis]|uniref:uncharacterized protein n=1 Tax=Asterias amurensis TaxID=7602 RepID=UPI003AB3CB93
MAENSSGKRMLISFTLPISCQICLGKVKQPIVCPNQHVFCSVCIELWLQHNQQCPTCRVPITPENPCKQILGGQTQDGENDSYMSTPALRRARFDILYQDCEREIKRLEDENKFLKNSNCDLQDRLTEAEKMVAAKSELISNEAGATSSSSTTESKLQLNSKTWRDSTNSSPKSSPSRGKVKSRGEKRESFSSTDGNYNCDEGVNGEVLASLRSKLKQATTTYDRIKQDMDKLKETNLKLSTDNRTLLAENGRLKQTATARSPHKYEKYTSMAQQTKLDQSRREVSQLKRALDRSDTYIDELETKVEGYKSQYGALTKESGGSGDNSKSTSPRDSSEDPGTRDDGDIPSTSSSGIFKPMGMGEKWNPLIVLGKDRHSTMPVYTSQNPSMSTDVFTDETYRNYIKNKKASRVCVTQQDEHRKGSASLSREDDSDDVSDLEYSDAMMTNTPSTALDRLSLDSFKKVSVAETQSSKPSKVSPSCHRHLNFGKDHPKDSDLHIKEGNVADDDPLDQNATFSDLNFTMTSELSDCAQLMKDAEMRVKKKKLNSQDINPEDQSGMKALQCSSDKPAFKDSKLKYFGNPISHSDPTSNREPHEKTTVSVSQINQDPASTHLTWSGFKPGFRSTPRSVSSRSTEEINISSSHALTVAQTFSNYTSSSGSTGTLSLPCTVNEQLKGSNTAAGYPATSESLQKTSLCYPAIKSQLKPTWCLDAAQLRNGHGTGSRSRSDVDSDRNACTFDFLSNKPYANNKGDKVNSEWVSQSANDPKVQTSSGAISSETGMKGYLPSTNRDSRKRYVPHEKGSNSPSKAFKY